MNAESQTRRRAPAKKPKRTAKPKGRTYTAIAAQFEEDVLSGRFPACELFRMAIEKHRREVASPPPGYVFDADVGDRFCRRAERLPFHEGKGLRGTPFILQGWQVWMFHTLFSWRDPVTQHPRFREASLWMPKGQGKSPLAALLALTVLLVAKDGEKVYSAASTQKQARHVFDAAKEMLRLAPDVREHFGLVVEEHKIKGAEDNRAYEPVSSEAGSIEGIRPTVIVLDEVHVLPNRKLYDNLSSAANKVDGSLLITISTAGFDMSKEAIGWELYGRARDVLLGKRDDPTMFALIIGADRKKPDGTEASPLDFEVWRQANPNLGVSVSVAGIHKAMRTWRDTPSERPSLEVKHLLWWQATASTFLDIRRWTALGNQSLRLEDLKPDEGWTVTLGADLARTRDITALPVVASRRGEDGRRRYRIFTRFAYLPALSPTVDDDYRKWAKEGWMTLVPGPSMSLAPLKAEALALADRFPDFELCVDDWGALELENELMATKKIVVISVRQGAKTLSEPMKELESAILDGRIEHDGSPVTEMCIGNLQAERNRNDGIAPTRESEYKKIDIAVGIINALVRARLDVTTVASTSSYLETEDVLVL